VENLIKGYSVVFVPSRNIDESIQWYQKNLGLVWDQWIMKVPSGAPLFFVESNDNWTFSDNKGNESAALSFLVEDANKLHSQLKENKVEVEQTTRQIEGIGIQFWFVDPSGNRLLATQQQ
jgi:predicted enzyme related to lactoylglutathione lyase